MPAVALQAFYKQGDGVFIAIVFMSCLFLHAAASRRRGAFVAGRLVGPGVCVCGGSGAVLYSPCSASRDRHGGVPSRPRLARVGRCCVPLLAIHLKRRRSDVEAQRGDGRVGDGRYGLTWDVTRLQALRLKQAWT